MDYIHIELLNKKINDAYVRDDQSRLGQLHNYLKIHQMKKYNDLLRDENGLMRAKQFAEQYGLNDEDMHVQPMDLKVKNLRIF